MNVEQLLNDVYNGRMVLPDFQRTFIWEPEDVRELLVSVLGDYFIGSMLLLEHFKGDSPFALQLIEGVKEANKSAEIQSIVRILLDGQQRTSALFYALYDINIPLKNRKSPYRFYLDLEKALAKEWDDAVIAVSVSDRKGLGEIKQKSHVIPFSLLKNIGELVQRFRDHPQLNEIINLANGFMNRPIHYVALSREIDLERIVETFERINRTGEPLSVFELLTAKLYRHSIKLRDLFKSAQSTYGFIDQVSPEYILKVIALLRGKESKRKSILELDPEHFQQDWERACEALETAYKRTIDIKNGYGVLDFKKWMPYTTMLIPLAAMIDFVITSNLQTKANYDKIDQWYWTSVFSNRYDQAADTTSTADFTVIRTWITDGQCPEFVDKFNPDAVELDTDKQSSAIYRGVINIVVLTGAFDFRTGQAPQFDKEKVQDDHIFPKSIYNCHQITNRSLISTNTMKGDKKPSEYFKQRLTEHGEEKLKAILASHLIPIRGLNYLLHDDLENFVKARKQAIIYNLRNRLQARKI